MLLQMKQGRERILPFDLKIWGYEDFLIFVVL